jgi:hypothetical protein
VDDDAIEIPANDPLEAAIQVRKKIFDLRRGYRRNLWRCVAEAYAVAFAMASNRKAWKELLAEDFWHHYRKKRPSVKSTEKALLHVMVFVFDATSKNRYDRAWKYAKALEKHFNDKVPPEHIEEVIEENSGLEKMMRAASGKRKGHKKGARAAREGSSSDDALGADEDADAGNEANENHDRKKSKPVKGDGKDKSERSRGGEVKHKPLKARRYYQFIARKKCGPKLRRLKKSQKARITVEMVYRGEQLLPRVIGIQVLKN